MILADTCIWVRHFRYGMPAFAAALENGSIWIHPVVLGELATGNLANRTQTLSALSCLPQVKSGTAEECLRFIETHTLYGKGLSWSDIQLLVAARLSGVPLWTLDQRLNVAAAALGVAHAAS